MRLFIDDERNPADFMDNWKGKGECDVHVRSSRAAIGVLEDWIGRDEPLSVWFDHDLGGDDTTMPVVMWLSEAAFDGRLIPHNIVVHVHTQNPVGRDNITETLSRWGFYPHQIGV